MKAYNSLGLQICKNNTKVFTLISICLLCLTGCGGGRNISYYAGEWKGDFLDLTLDQNGRYVMKNFAGTDTGYMRHDSGDWFIFKDDNGAEEKFKIIISNDVLTLESQGGTPLKLNRVVNSDEENPQ